jgi:hypothetical protein
LSPSLAGVIAEASRRGRLNAAFQAVLRTSRDVRNTAGNIFTPDNTLSVSDGGLVI